MKDGGAFTAVRGFKGVPGRDIRTSRPATHSEGSTPAARADGW